MNLPNKLTLARFILIPFFIAALYIDAIPFNIFIALVIFAVASFTDMLDGKIARARNLVTNFGKFMDPLADKALVMAALVAFIELGWCSAIAVIIILTREFMVSSLRLVANNSSGKVIAAGFMGKLKTAFTMVAIVVILFLQGLASVDVNVPYTNLIGEILVWAAVFFTVVSGIQYLMGYWDLIDTDK